MHKKKCGASKERNRGIKCDTCEKYFAKNANLNPQKITHNVRMKVGDRHYFEQVLENSLCCQF